MTNKVTTDATDATDAINIANPAIDNQAGGAGEQAQATRAELNKSMSEADAAIRDQAGGGSGHSKP
jgi:hypothetical protein